MAQGKRSQTPLRLAAGVAALLVAAISVPDPAEAQRKRPAQKRPNVLVVMTDDQTVESMKVMPRTTALLGRRGVTFTNSLASFPLCCPSRATFLTGQYADNHGVRTNQSPGGGYARLKHAKTLPVWLRRSGYYTAHVGKYMNGYGSQSPDTEVPPGWSEWYGALDNPDAYTGGTYTMYGYTLNENGAIVHYGSTPDVVDPATYQTDVYSRKAQDFVHRRAPKRKPFFLSVAPLAPHSEAAVACDCAGDNPRAAPRHQGALAGLLAPRPPSFNEPDVSDKPADIRNLSLMNETQIATADTRYRARLESQLAVDEMVAKLVGALKSEGELRNTLIAFTSDNGFFHGEHRVRTGKVRHYLESSEVPLIIRGPGVPQGKRRSQLVANIDLAPTILDYANARADRKLDGRSLRPLISSGLVEPGRGILVEAFHNSDPEEPDLRYNAVRTGRYVYAEHDTAEQELYDLRDDPFQTFSRHDDPDYAAIRSRLDRLLARLAACAGSSCRVRPAVRLRLRYRRGRTTAGRRCVRGGVRARVVGRQRGDAVRARFFAGNRRAGRDATRPLRRRIGRRRLNRGRATRIRALVTVLDGRVVSVRRAVPPRC